MIVNNEAFTEHLYDDSTDGYIQVLKLKNDKSVNIYNVTTSNLIDTIDLLQEEYDVFVTPNTMFKKARRVNYIRQFRSLFQDIDCHSLGIHQSEAVYIIWILYYDGKIPKPTMVTDTGRGIHVYFRIKNAPYGALSTWQELQDYIYYQLKHLGADRNATDGARLLRIPGTKNSKCDLYCKIVYIDNETEYSMYDLREKFLNYSDRTHQLQVAEIKNISRKIIFNKFFNSYSLHIERAKDLEVLCKLRNYNMTGFRNMIIHCYAYWKGIYLRDSFELESVVIEFNNSFIEPLKDTEIQAILRCTDKAIDKFINYEQGIRNKEIRRVSKGMRDKDGYWYKNETLIDLLQITEEEQKHLKTIIGINEKYYRNNIRRTPRNENNLTKKQQEIKDLKDKILYLKEQKLSNREIGKYLDINERRVRYILKTKY